MQHQFQQSRPTLRRVLLLSTAFTGVLALGVAGHSDRALASCAVSASPNVVSCDTTVTTATGNFDAALTTSNDYSQVFNTGGAVTAGVNAGQAVSGQGLWIVAAELGAPITFTNNGAVLGPGDGLKLASNAGNITYFGNGSVSGTTAGVGGLVIMVTGAGSITVGTSGAPVAANFSGSSALVAQSGAGATDVFLNGGSLTATGAAGGGLSLINGSGNVSATLTGNTTIANASGAPTPLSASVRNRLAVMSTSRRTPISAAPVQCSEPAFKSSQAVEMLIYPKPAGRSSPARPGCLQWVVTRFQSIRTQAARLPCPAELVSRPPRMPAQSTSPPPARSAGRIRASMRASSAAPIPAMSPSL
ncbi:hypothetical protein [Bradyrhizobium sp. 186]|uniref:hypothetical protein n=1 Tax=Bradyrhizobium sp. 186 TaxID=2782654 RepID=UPI0020014471|nr:hypothetical protein [Bradyrhizobium sp. 186]